MLRFRAFKAVQSLVERLPRPWAYGLAVFAARFAFWFSPLARPRLQFNLQVACPDLDDRELRRITWLNFRNHAKAYADLMMLPRTQVSAMRPLLKVEGWANLEAARALGKGVMAVSCHMGSYEVVSAIWAATLTPVSFFAEELEPRALFEWYRDTRARLGISVLTLSVAGIRKVTQALQALQLGEGGIDVADRDDAGNAGHHDHRQQQHEAGEGQLTDRKRERPYPSNDGVKGHGDPDRLRAVQFYTLESAPRGTTGTCQPRTIHPAAPRKLQVRCFRGARQG